MREIIVFTNEELQSLMEPGNEIEFRTRDGRRLVFVSEDTFDREYKKNNMGGDS